MGLRSDISFEVTGAIDQRIVVRVTFELEAPPQWNDRATSQADRRSIGIESDLDPSALREAAQDLRRELASLEGP